MLFWVGDGLLGPLGHGTATQAPKFLHINLIMLQKFLKLLISSQ